MCFQNQIYAVKGAQCVFIMNILMPGFGTMLQSFLGKKCSPATFFLGVLQAFCTLLIFGWCWAIWHGYMVKAVSHPEYEGKPAPESELTPEQLENFKKSQEEAQ